MTPTLIVLALLALGVAIVSFATRRPPGQPVRPHSDQDTAWNDPATPADAHPFAHAPDLERENPANTASDPLPAPATGEPR